MASTMVIVKAELAGELRRTSFDPETVTYSQLCKRLEELFHVSGPFKLTYIDEEADRVTIAGDLDIKETVRVAKQLNNVLKVKIELLDGGKTKSPATSFGVEEEELWEIARLAESRERTFSSTSSTPSTPQQQIQEQSNDDDDELSKLAAMMSSFDVQEKGKESTGIIERNFERDEACLGKLPQETHEIEQETECTTESKNEKKEIGQEKETAKTETSSVTSSATYDVQFRSLLTDIEQENGTTASVSSLRSEGNLPTYTSDAPPIPTKIGSGVGGSSTFGNNHSSTERQAPWFDHMINEGQFHRLILQTRLEHEIATIANDPRIAATVSEVYERLKATAQFTEQQLAQVKSYLYEALNRVIGSPTTEGGVPRAEGASGSGTGNNSSLTDIAREREQEVSACESLPTRDQIVSSESDREESSKRGVPNIARESSKEEQMASFGINDQSRSPVRPPRRVLVDYEPRPAPVQAHAMNQPFTEHTGEYPPALPVCPFPVMSRPGSGSAFMVPTARAPVSKEPQQCHPQEPQQYHPIGFLNLNSLEPVLPPPLPPLPPGHPLHIPPNPFPEGNQLPPPHQHTYSPFPMNYIPPAGEMEEVDTSDEEDFPNVSPRDLQRYAQQLEMLHSMGITDDINSVRLLRRADGDVNVVVNWLFRE